MVTGNAGTVQVGDWIVNPSLDTVSRGDEIQKLEPRTMRLLICLIEARGAVVSQDRLLSDVWSGVVVGPASVYQAVSQLRKIFNDLEQQPRYIATVPRKGYRLVATVTRPVPAYPAAAADAANTGDAPAAMTGDAPASAMSPLPAIPAAASSAVTTSSEGARPGVRHARWRVASILTTALLAATVIGWTWMKGSLSGDTSGVSIAVLPFVDMTAEKNGQAFCDGLSEELSNWLSQIPLLRVVARTSAFAFRSSSKDVREIGKTLGTSHILEGSMRRFADHTRVTVQLIDARNGYHLWSANYDQPMQDTIRMQSDIARSVAQNLQMRLTPAATSQFAARGTDNAEAYQLYLQARYYHHQRTRESNRQAIDLYYQVLKLDPKFTLAYVGLSYSRLNQQSLEDRPIGDIAVEVEALIASALRLDPRMPDVYAVRAALRSDQNRIKEAQEDLNFAISLNPNDSIAFAELGRLSLRKGQPRDALVSFSRAVALDPLDFDLKIQQCTAFEDMARYDEALTACERAHQLQSDNAPAVNKLAWLAWSRGSMGDALRWNRESLRLAPDTFDYYWTRAELYWTLGLAKRARATLEQGRDATRDEETAGVALGNVAYLEGGAEALRSQLNAARLDESRHSLILEEVARLRLLLGEPKAAADLIDRALAAPDRDPELMDTPWSARSGESCQLVLAAAEMQMGERSAAAARLAGLLSMLDGMIGAGVERSATYALRAEAQAMLGHGDAAIQDLNKAAALGWRRAWWAQHEPYFASLRSRADFQQLMNRVDESNARLLNDLNITDTPERLARLIAARSQVDAALLSRWRFLSVLASRDGPFVLGGGVARGDDAAQ
jgi:TolB-like protein/DNA-binding winged helix-turn-helix (wHTH) protein/tetratricopeptide (TPR) repeat protein